MTRAENRSKWTWLAIAAVIATYAAFTIYALSHPMPWLLDFCLHDDSFYYLKTARNFAAGLGSTFDGINYTNGYHPLWFVLMAGMYLLKPGLYAAVVWSMAIEAVIYAVAMAVMMRFLVRGGVRPVFAAAAAGVVYVAIMPMAGWNGLETGLFALMSVLALVMLDRSDRQPLTPRFALLLGTVLALAVLTRLDTMLLALIVSPLVLWRAWRLPDRWRVLAAYVLPLAVLLGGYLLINLASTGQLQPVSGRAKQSGKFGQGAPPASLVSVIVPGDVRTSWKSGLWVAAGVLVRDARRRRLTGVGCFSLAALATYGYYLARFDRLGADTYWYYLPQFHLLCFGLAWTGQWLSDRWRPLARVVAPAAVLVTLAMVAMRGRQLIQYGDRPPDDRAKYYQMAMWVRDNTPPDTRIGMWDSGIVAYFGERTVINLDGLINSHDYLDRYRLTNREPHYIREHRIPYIISYTGYFESPASPYRQLLAEEYEIVYRDYLWVAKRRGG